MKASRLNLMSQLFNLNDFICVAHLMEHRWILGKLRKKVEWRPPDISSEFIKPKHNEITKINSIWGDALIGCKKIKRLGEGFDYAQSRRNRSLFRYAGLMRASSEQLSDLHQ
jgi:hypothetical protein